MSNFMHKVKEAVTDHHEKDDVPTNEPAGTHHTYRSTNPYNKDPVAAQQNPSMMNAESGAGTGRGSGNHGAARGPDTYDTTTTGANTTNAGPHNSKVANKLDPSVDSDLDHRAQHPGTRGATGTQNVGAAPQTTNTGNMAPGRENMAPSEQPRAFGTDTHTSNEDKYNKATQEHKAHKQPGVPGSGNQMSSEDSYSSSTQENKAHSTTSHTTPCQMKPTAEEPGPQGRAAQPEFGGSAAGGSSYAQPPVREQAGMQNTNRTGKVDPQAQGMGYQQSDIGNQRSGY
jgi:hypothetical protein